MEQMVNENVNVGQQNQRPKKKIWKGLLFSILALLAALAVQMVVGIPMAAIIMVQCMMQAGGDANAAQQLYVEATMGTEFMTNLLVVSTAAYGIVVLLWYKFAYVKKYTAEKRAAFKETVCKSKVIGSLVIAAVGCYCLDILVASFVSILSPEALEVFNSSMEAVLSGDELMAFLVVVILAPIAEEILFRGIVFNMLSKHWSEVAAIIVSTVLFGLYHGNLMQAIYVLPIGLLLGYTAYKCKSVLPCIVIHMINNFMPCVVALLPEALQVEWFFAIIVVVCGGTLYFIWKMPKKVQTIA
ncbi:MAG: CPBP family intramembrane metalloprotease [Lachnospiraceae bacterium]|nr:CPBP family intramembrane metalloprotease [Lachnospiraceae bacterium]